MTDSLSIYGNSYAEIRCFKAHTHQAIHNDADRICDRSPVGMIDWNVHV